MTQKNVLEDSRKQKAIVLLAAFAVLLFCDIVAFGAFFARKADVELFCLSFCFANLCYLLGPVWSLARGGMKGVISPASLIGLATFYYITRVGITLFGDGSKVLWQMTESQIREALLFSVSFVGGGFVAFWMASELCIFLLGGGRQSAKVARLVMTPAAKIGIGVAFCFGLVGVVLLVKALGWDPLLLWKQPHMRAYLSDPVYGVGDARVYLYFYLINGLPVALWSMIILRDRKNGPIFSGRVILGAILLSAGCYVLFKTRAEIAGFFGGTALVWHVYRKPIPARAFIMSVICMVVGFVCVAEWRGAAVRAGKEAGVVGIADTFVSDIDGIFVRAIERMDLSDIHTMALLVHNYKENSDFLWGRSIFRVFYQFVPRGIWAGKPYDIAVDIEQLWRPGSMSGLPPGMYGECFLNFGPFLGVGFVGVLGFLMTVFYVVMIRRCYGIEWLFYVAVINRIALIPFTSLSSIVFMWVVTAFPLVIIYPFCRKCRVYC